MSKRTFVWLFVWLLSSSAAFGQATRPVPVPNPTFEIRGKLMFTTTNPPEERIEVALERSMQKIQTVYTDSLGQFEFRGLTSGLYAISVRLPGYEDINQQVEVYNMQRSTMVTIPMNPVFSVRRTKAAGFEGDDDDVVDISQLTKKYPKKAIQEYEKAIQANRKGDLAKAIQHLEEATKVAPDFYHAHNNLGVAYLKTNRYQDAEKEYQRARTLNPKADQPLLNLAILYITQSDLKREEGREVFGKLLDDAMDNLDEIIKMKPQSAVAHFYLGAAYYKSDFLTEAEASLKKASSLDPTLIGVRPMLVNVYVKQKRWPDVVNQIDAYLKENPKAEERKAMEELRQKVSRQPEVFRR